MENLLALIQGCARNDGRCQKAIYEKYFGFGLKIAYRYLDRYESATEAANDGFIRIFKSMGRFEVRNPKLLEPLFVGWMRKILINTSLNYLQRQEQYWDRHISSVQLPDKTFTSQRADNALLYKELIEMIRQLSPGYRAVFNLYVIDGYSHQEIAELLGISVGTSKSNLSKARAFLQKHLVQTDSDFTLCFS